MKFKIGDGVRIIKGTQIGKTGFITGKGVHSYFGMNGNTYYVVLDGSIIPMEWSENFLDFAHAETPDNTDSLPEGSE